MTVTIYQMVDRGTAPRFNQAFHKGCPDSKISATRDGSIPEIYPGDVALWGEHQFFRTLHKLIDEGRTWYYGDHAYFGRGVYFRVTKNALQCNGRYPSAGPEYADNMERFAQVSDTLRQNQIQSEIEIHAPRFDANGFVMICPPSEFLSERSGFTQAAWTDKTIEKVKAVTDRRIVIRQKPTVNRTPAPLLQAMEGAYCAVTYTSNVATEVLLGGYPCFTFGPHPCNVFSQTDFENFENASVPPVDALKAWAANLCANQWTLAEIARGDCWNKVGAR